MGDKLRVGVIGCGDMSRNHAFGYLRADRYEIVALADLSSDAMRDFDEHFAEYSDYKAEHFTDFREMLTQSTLDVVSVGVWDKGHKPMTLAAAASGVKAILCEKPMADTLGAAADMRLVCERHNVKLGIGHQRRWIPAYNLAKEMIADGEIGDVRMITAFARDGLPNYSSHQADMFRYLLDDPECTWVMGNVERETNQFARSIPIEDKALGLFGFEGGAQAMIIASLTPRAGWGAWISGSDGLIDLSLNDVKLMNAKTGGWQQHYPDGDYQKNGEDTGFEVAYDNVDVQEAAIAQARDFAAWVSGETDYFRGEAQHGYKALEMVHAVYESARTHTQVQLPMKTMVHPLELMIDEGELPVRYPGKYDIRNRSLRGENTVSDEDNV